jgi:hypothetical protein
VFLFDENLYSGCRFCVGVFDSDLSSDNVDKIFTFHLLYNFVAVTKDNAAINYRFSIKRPVGVGSQYLSKWKHRKEKKKEQFSQKPMGALENTHCQLKH